MSAKNLFILFRTAYSLDHGYIYLLKIDCCFLYLIRMPYILILIQTNPEVSRSFFLRDYFIIKRTLVYERFSRVVVRYLFYLDFSAYLFQQGIKFIQ